MAEPGKSSSSKQAWLASLNLSLLLLGFKNLLPASHTLDRPDNYRWMVFTAITSAALGVLLHLQQNDAKPELLGWRMFATSLAVLSTAESYLYLYFPGQETGFAIMIILVVGRIVFAWRSKRREEEEANRFNALKGIMHLQRAMEALTSQLIKADRPEQHALHVEAMLRSMDGMIAGVEATDVEAAKTVSDYIRDTRAGLRLVHELLLALAKTPSSASQDRRDLLAKVLAQMNTLHKKGAAIERAEELRR